MTKNQSKKHAARDTARAESINYTAARRMVTVVAQLTSRPASQIVPTIAAEHFGINVDQWVDRLASIDGTVHRLDFLYSAEGFVGTIEYTSQMSGRSFAPFPRGEADNAVRILNTTVGMHERDDRAAILDLIARQRRAGTALVYTDIRPDHAERYRGLGFTTLETVQGIDYVAAGEPSSFANPVRSFEAWTKGNVVAYVQLDGTMTVTEYTEIGGTNYWEWLQDEISAFGDEPGPKYGSAVKAEWVAATDGTDGGEWVPVTKTESNSVEARQRELSKSLFLPTFVDRAPADNTDSPTDHEITDGKPTP